VQRVWQHPESLVHLRATAQERGFLQQIAGGGFA